MISASSLSDALRHGPLLSSDRMAEAERLAASEPVADVLARLVERGWLTQYQATELSEGRGYGLKFGPYVLLDSLGAGGMGEVFRVRHAIMDREVALKRMLPNLRRDADLVARFSREAKLAAKLSYPPHPNVVQVIHADEVSGVPYMTMELLEGTDLKTYLEKRGPLPVGEAIEYVRQACVGMQHAHEKGVVHRDLKPGNLWRTTGRIVKVLDMGMAVAAAGTKLTVPGAGGGGSLDYMAPEQMSNFAGVDTRADVFSLGCTLYHLLTNRTPFCGPEYPMARPSMHLTQRPTPIEEIRTDVPKAVADAVRKMMFATPEGRYATPGEAATALASFLKKREPPARRELVNSIGMRFVLVPAGTFWMGATKEEDDEAHDAEGPPHEVEITKAFWMGVHPVTQKQWKAVMGNNPSYFCATGGGKAKVQGMDTDDFPVEQVSWQDAQDFLKKLAAMREEAENRREYRLPTEAEWEYSCRNSGRYQKYHFGNTLSHEHANFGKKLGPTSSVGSFAPNERGLHDMHGNVWEWCADWFDSGYYANSPRRDPSGPPHGPDRVGRGGSWFVESRLCRCADRSRGSPELRSHLLGFRVALVPAP